MISDPTVERPDPAQADLPEPVIGTPWADRSSEDLRRIMAHGFQAGEDFENASREMERRARVMTAGAEDSETARRLGQIRFGRYVLVGLGLVFLVGLIAGLLT